MSDLESSPTPEPEPQPEPEPTPEPGPVPRARKRQQAQVEPTGLDDHNPKIIRRAQLVLSAVRAVGPAQAARVLRPADVRVIKEWAQQL